MRESREQEAAMKRYFAQKPVMLRGPGERYPTREEIHDRTRVRWHERAVASH